MADQEYENKSCCEKKIATKSLLKKVQWKIRCLV